jgi:hypothetical protein
MPRLSKERRASQATAAARKRDFQSGKFLPTRTAFEEQVDDNYDCTQVEEDDSSMVYINNDEDEAEYLRSCKAWRHKLKKQMAIAHRTLQISSLESIIRAVRRH